MKIWMLSLLLAGPAFTQPTGVETVRIARDNASVFPHIGKYYDGEIPVTVLGDPKGIEGGADCYVVSFTISYANQKVSVPGRNIPRHILQDIYKSCLHEMIFITDIKALDENGTIIYLMPMHLIPVASEE
jgi:hypothetical protein